MMTLTYAQARGLTAMFSGRRPLSPIEAISVKLRTFIIYSVLVEGTIDVVAMRRAFAALREVHPLLAALLQSSAGGEAFLTAVAAPKEIFVVSEGEPDAQAQPALALDQSVALSGIEITQAKDRARVDLHIFQGIADSCHGLALFEELWSHYTDVVTTGETKVEIEPIPASFEELLAVRGVCKGGKTGLEWLAGPADAEPRPAPKTHAITVSSGRLRLAKEATRALAHVARSHGTTIDALIASATLAAAARFHPSAAVCTELRGLPRATFNGEATPVLMPYLYAVDPRPWLTPPVGRTEGTHIVSLASYLASFGPSTSLLDVARGMSDRLNEEVAAGIIQQLMLHESVTTPPEHMTPPSDVVIVYGGSWGIVPDLRTPPGLVPTDFTGFTLPHAYTHAGVPMFLSSIFRGQLSLQATFPAARPGLPTARQLLDVAQALIDSLLE